MKHERYIVTTSVGKRSWHVVWEGEGELALDHPSNWHLSLDENLFPKLRQEKHGNTKAQEVGFTDGNLDEGFEVTLPSVIVRRGKRDVKVRIQRVRPIVPAYAPTSLNPKSAILPSAELFVYSGVHNFLLETRKITRAFGSLLAGERVFAFGRSGHGYNFKSYAEGVTIETIDGDVHKLMVGEIEFVDGPAFEKATIRYGNYWWRINQVNRPADLTGLLYEEQDIPESLWFKRVAKSLGMMLLVFGIFAHFGKTWILSGKKVEAPASVAWKQPKLLPPPVALKKIEPEIPKPKKEEPPKVAEKKPPVKKPVVKKETPPPKVAKVPPPVQKAPPPPTPAPSVVAQKELAKSLSFLTPSKKGAAPVVVDNKPRYKDAAPVDMKNSKLRDLSSKEETQVDLRNTREMNADGGIKNRDKSLNSVQGKVALNALYDPNATAGLGDAVGDGKSFAVSGVGKLSSKEIEKALSKFLGKFQYCYEKALLSEPSAAGTVVMQWTLGSGGGVSAIKVLKSAIANKGLQTCLAEQLGKVPFPKPTGGDVTIQFPFAFSSSSL